MIYRRILLYFLAIVTIFSIQTCILEPVKTPCEKSCDTKLMLCYALFSQNSDGSTADLVAPIFLCEGLHSTCYEWCYYE